MGGKNFCVAEDAHRRRPLAPLEERERQREQCVAVEPEMFQVLLYLLQHHDRVVRCLP